MNKEVLPKCLSCGVCCFSRLETYVRVTGDDWARLGEDASSYAHFIGHRAYMKMGDEHCAALEVRKGSSSEREYFCVIYDRRPQTCRDLKRGSPECDGERVLKSDRPLLVKVSANLAFSSAVDAIDRSDPASDRHRKADLRLVPDE